MKESKEILVKDIKELTPAIRIKVIKCIHCNKTHEHITLNSKIATFKHPDKNELIDEFGVQVLPLPLCSNAPTRWITERAVNERRVFKLLDLDDYFESEETTKNKLCEEMAARKKTVNV